MIAAYLAAFIHETSWSQESSRPQKARPDILFIAVDDLNDWVGHLGGHPQAKTPNIDRLVSRGLVFTNAHCVAPACNPSRAALMSGIRPWETGIYLNPHFAAPVLKKTITINRHFLNNGYKVFGGGKIYHGVSSEGRGKGSTIDSWSEWAGRFSTKGGGKAKNLNGLNKAHFDWGPLTIDSKSMGDHQLTDWAIKKILNPPPNQPMFLAVGYVKPHLPWHVPQKYFDRFPLETIQPPITKPNDLADLPSAGIRMANPKGDHAAVVKGKQWKKAVQGYLATVSFLDDEVGRLTDALQKSRRPTIVIWWTDHGWHLGEKQHWRKFALWNDATRTSFAIAAPGITQPNTSTDAPVDYLSLFPTLCDLADLNKPKHLSGPSLVPLLKNPEADWDPIAICTHGRGNHAIISRTHRLIHYANGDRELYDRKADPHEWRNLAKESTHASILSQLAKHLPAKEALPLKANKAPEKRERSRKSKKEKAPGNTNGSATSSKGSF